MKSASSRDKPLAHLPTTVSMPYTDAEKKKMRQGGAFVYTGAGQRQPTDAPPEQVQCKQFAIAMQYCLARNNHKQTRCEESVKAWKECCARVRANAEKERTVE